MTRWCFFNSLISLILLIKSFFLFLSNVLVYQMGGNTIEVTYIKVINGLYQCVNSISLKNIGGDVFTDIVVDILSEEFIRYVIN